MVLEGILITKAALTRKIINTLTSELTVFEERMSRMESSMQNMTSNVIHQILLNAKPFPPLPELVQLNSFEPRGCSSTSSSQK